MTPFLPNDQDKKINEEDEADELGSLMSIRSEGVSVELPRDFSEKNPKTRPAFGRNGISIIRKMKSKILSDQ
jgi:hypothetical protein